MSVVCCRKPLSWEAVLPVIPGLPGFTVRKCRQHFHCRHQLSICGGAASELLILAATTLVPVWSWNWLYWWRRSRRAQPFSVAAKRACLVDFRNEGDSLRTKDAVKGIIMTRIPPLNCGRSTCLVIVLLFTLVGTVLGQREHSVASAGAGYGCSTLVDRISMSGLDIEASASVFGCRQDPSGGWYMPSIEAANAGPVIDQMTPFGEVILEAVDRMSMDRAFINSVQYDRELSVAHVSGAGGKVEAIDLSMELISFAPEQWWLRDAYYQSLRVYFTGGLGTETELVSYIDWFLVRRDLTITTLAYNLHPLFASTFADTWGYGTVPWPWQLADPAAITAFTKEASVGFTPERTHSHLLSSFQELHRSHHLLLSAAHMPSRPSAKRSQTSVR